MVEIFSYEAGKTLNSHKRFLKKLERKGAKVVDSHSENPVVIVFCPIVSRYETDVSAALSKASERGYEHVILVAMHHTFDEQYTIPNHERYEHRDLRLLVDCLFFEDKGLLKCPRNKKAVKEVCEELGLKRLTC